MSRLFDQHRVRMTKSLDGTWEFYFPAEGTTLEPGDWAAGDRVEMRVPGVWEMLDARRNYRGQAVARRRISLEQEGFVRLVFKGVSHTARVFFDGEEVGGHHHAYTPFSLDAGWAAVGEHEILVHVSNEHGNLSALHFPNDYYNYGGISRPVELHVIPDGVMIRHVHAIPASEASAWTLSCRAEILNLGSEVRSVRLRAELESVVVEKDARLEPGSNLVQWEMSFEGVESWEPGNPALYLLNTQLGEAGRVVDDLVERVGFRTVSVRGVDILLNGRRIFPMGFNRHEDHALYGCAIPVDTMRSDLALLREMNGNAVRTCHYPNDERFLDLCDEQGILVWEENHGRGLGIERMRHPRFREQCAACNEEMVREHFNHPCIFVWGILNECESGTEEGAALYAEQFEQLRALDPSRPVTFASNRHAGDSCQGMVDIAGWNIYPRWYHDTPVQQYVDDQVALHETEGMAGKPLIVSEFGAGALPGYHDPVRRAKWSEERQCDILDEQLEVILQHPRVRGAFVWQFCDVRVDPAWAISRPRTMNNKGAVDEFRRRKLVFEVIQRHFARKQGAMRA